MKNISILIAFFQFMVFNVIAQSDFKRGYIIKNNNDTIYGIIANKRNTYSAQYCIFKINDQAPKQVFSPEDIKAYRFLDGKYYISNQITEGDVKKRVFLEYLIKGIVNVYYYEDKEGEHYFANKTGDSILHELKNSDDVYSNDESGQNGSSIFLKSDATYHFSKREYIGLLKYMFQDSPKVCDEVDNLLLSHKSLIKIAREYHNSVCSGDECIVYEKKEAKNQLFFGPIIGLNEISFSKGKSSDPLECFQNAQFNSVFYPSFGIFVKARMPYINNENLYLQYEVSVSHVSFHASNPYTVPEGTTTYVYDMTEHQSTLNNNLFLKWELLKGKIRPTFQLGILVRSLIKSDFAISRSVKHSYSSEETHEDLTINGSVFNSTDMMPTIGVGLKSKITKYRELFVDFRGSFYTGLEALKHVYSNVFSMNIGLQINK